MKLYNWTEVIEEPLTPTATRQMIHGSTLTVAKLRTKKGSIVPTHSHVNEQITTMEKGAMLFVTPTEQIVVRAGESLSPWKIAWPSIFFLPFGRIGCGAMTPICAGSVVIAIARYVVALYQWTTPSSA